MLSYPARYTCDRRGDATWRRDVAKERARRRSTAMEPTAHLTAAVVELEPDATLHLAQPQLELERADRVEVPRRPAEITAEITIPLQVDGAPVLQPRAVQPAGARAEARNLTHRPRGEHVTDRAARRAALGGAVVYQMQRAR